MMPENPGGKPADLTDEQVTMLRLIATEKPLPWDPQSLIRLQTLKLIERGVSAFDWTVTPDGAAVLDRVGRLDPPKDLTSN